MPKFLLSLFLFSLTSTVHAETPANTAPSKPPVFKVERTLERRLNELSTRGAAQVQILFPPTNVTLGGAIVGSLTSGIWCPAGYTELVYID